ncbi:hypothetical protein IFM89_018189 [Coptis chinensis]|uniref:EF-hand domain-containing protein n=1 Tax=Coptis chinensis TaxID=261450 RepID=A0A835I385_9MAGN|nr:hypothetical protein IFM89_018189 [Coptis chinensis]
MSGKSLSLLQSSDLEKIFASLDSDGDGDGLVCIGKLRMLLERVGFHVDLDELENLMGLKKFSLQDLILFYISVLPHTVEEVDQDLLDAFKVFDLNGDGFISSEELDIVLSKLGELRSPEDCKKMILKFDKNFDGMIDLEEFKDMMMLRTDETP